MNINYIKNWLQDNIDYEEKQIERSKKSRDELNAFMAHENLEVYNDLMTIVDAYSNAMPLQANRKKCPGCGEVFSPKNQAQEVCSGKCRVRMHRNKNRLKDFNQKVEEILRAKDPEAKFTVEQLMVENGKCPFVVTYQGTIYKADNTKSLLTQLNKI